MGEDFPLDPNQVQPPQDEQSEQSGHVEDIREGEEGYVHDEDKARAMAKAGDDAHTMANAKNEYDLPEGELRNRYRTRMSNRAYGAEGQGMTAKAMFEQEADREEERTGEEYEAARTSGYSHNVEKAMHMERAERGRERNLAAPTPKEAGDRYDAELADDIMGRPRAEALKDAPDYRVAAIFLRYASVLADSYRSHGDELTLNLKALELMAKPVSIDGRIQEYEFGKYLTVSVNTEAGGAVDITTGGRNIGGTTEKWHIPMFDEDPKGYRHTGSYRQPRDFAFYEVTETTRGTDEDFDTVQTKKKRALGDEDVDNLEKLFRKAWEYKAGERANTLYPGDDGYEEELAEINYGKD